MNMKNDITNSTIQCSVTNCAYHNPKNYCSLNQIKVGSCDANVTDCQGTECASFQLGNEGGIR